MIVGIAGYAGAGKDSIAEVLVREHGFERFGFADKLKRIALAVDPVIMGWGETIRLSDYVRNVGWEFAKQNPEIRRVLQALGMAVREELGPRTWIDALLDEVPFGTRTVIPDVRFWNEASTIRGLGGVIWRVDRPGIGPVNDHESEYLAARADGYFDAVIVNSGSLEDLSLMVGKAFGDAHNRPLSEALRADDPLHIHTCICDPDTGCPLRAHLLAQERGIAELEAECDRLRAKASNWYVNENVQAERDAALATLVRVRERLQTAIDGWTEAFPIGTGSESGVVRGIAQELRAILALIEGSCPSAA